MIEVGKASTGLKKAVGMWAKKSVLTSFTRVGAREDD
jgi:hypothetical protein